MKARLIFSHDNLKKQIDRVWQLTEKPFGANIPLDLKQSGVFIDTLIKEKVKIVVTAAGDPKGSEEGAAEAQCLHFWNRRDC